VLLRANAQLLINRRESESSMNRAHTLVSLLNLVLSIGHCARFRIEGLWANDVMFSTDADLKMAKVFFKVAIESRKMVDDARNDAIDARAVLRCRRGVRSEM
jgi:hypothetical protein